MVQVMMTSMNVWSLWLEKLPKVPFPCDSPVINVSSEVLFWAVGCDLVGKVGEAVPVSGTAIVPLQLQVSRN